MDKPRSAFGKPTNNPPPLQKKTVIRLAAQDYLKYLNIKKLPNSTPIRDL